MLQKGDVVPLDCELVDEHEHTTSLRTYLGSWVVVYFYPKDLTSGCTLEAEAFQSYQKQFQKQNTQVVGVSKDSCSSHQKFKEKKNITFTLIADTDHALMEAFGVWGERKFMGRTYTGTSRSTFLIDQKGVIAHVWEKVKPAGHAEEVLAVLHALQNKK